MKKKKNQKKIVDIIQILKIGINEIILEKKIWKPFETEKNSKFLDQQFSKTDFVKHVFFQKNSKKCVPSFGTKQKLKK